jgi:hypothetical protein
MGTQGFSGHAVSGGRGDVRATSRPITILAVSLAVLPLAAGCSGSSLPSFGSSNQQSTVPPPPTGSVAATGQPAYAPPPGQPAAQPGAYAAVPPAQAAASPEPGTVGSLTGSYVNFLKAFRDPEPDAATAGPARPPAYAQQPGAAPQQNAYVPRPPSTYVPSGQPYVPPQGQAGYPPPVQQNNAAPPPAQQKAVPAGQQSSATGSTKQAKAARTPSQQNAAAAPAQPPAAPPAAAPAAPAAQRDYSDSLPYPKQSLADVFRDSTETQTQTVPRPPSTYTPSGQPYTPGQAAGGAPAGGAVAAAPAAGQNSSNSLPYPKQSLFEVFSNEK